MKINIESTGLDLTPSIKTYIETKLTPLGRIIKRFETKGEITAFVEVGRSTKHHKHGDVFRASIDIEVPGKKLFAENESPDLRTAIDMVKNKIKDDIQKYKEKSTDKRK
ncbi:ribosome-associated translation inhibitor RaiA [Patescibacteria group bacterium]|nr:ribosome-associated translation inhibitor RaiA [Patescibacteria group bacterium]MCL5114218.1 ribosome-associated translation inhibitor RaiA [Patescibacteria group bacterium]